MQQQYDTIEKYCNQNLGRSQNSKTPQKECERKMLQIKKHTKR